nr:hypothetical protein [Tanacetum cinerariifolium]
MSIQEIGDLKQHYLDKILRLTKDFRIKDYRNEKIDIRFRRECEDMIDELKGKFNIMSIEINKKKDIQYSEQVANLSTYPSQRFKSFCCDDDDYDYEESTFPLNEIISQEPPSNKITSVLPTLEPEDSLIMGNKDLYTIYEKESDEFINSSGEDLVLILSESEDTSESDSECVLPSCADFSLIYIFEEKTMTFSNHLYNLNDDFTSSDDESLSDEDILEDNVKIYSNPFFEFDDEYISSDVNHVFDEVDVNHVFDEVLEDIECKDSYDSNLDEPTLLVTPLSDANEDECFDPGGDIDEIDAFLEIDVSTDIEDSYHDSKGYILYLESLLSDDTTPNPPPEVLEDIECKDSYDSNLDEPTLLVTPLSDANEDECFDPGGDIDEIDAFLEIDVSTDIEDSYHDSKGYILYLESLLSDDTTPNPPPEVLLDRDPRSLSYINDLKIMVKVFDPGIHEKFFSPTYMSLPFEDRQYLFFIYVIRIFLPYFTYPVNSPFLLSSGSEDTIFNPDIFAFHFSLESVVSYQSGTFMCFNVYLNILNESPMEICYSTYSVPNITMMWGESS